MQNHGIHIPFAAPMSFSTNAVVSRRLRRNVVFPEHISMITFCLAGSANCSPGWGLSIGPDKNPANSFISLYRVIYSSTCLTFPGAANFRFATRSLVLLTVLFESLAMISPGGRLFRLDWMTNWKKQGAWPVNHSFILNVCFKQRFEK